VSSSTPTIHPSPWPRQVVADRADAAQALHDDGHSQYRPALDEPLEAAELHDVQPRLVDLVVAVVQVDGHLAVPLDAGHRLDDFDQLGSPCCGLLSRT
jgi:hypothetical protein